MTFFLRSIPLFLLLTSLAACGGGGGSGGGSDAPSSETAASTTRPLTVEMETSATWSVAPAEVNFTATGSAPAAEYHWSFGDGTEAVGAEAAHVYLEPGTYTPTVTIIDDQGRRERAEGTVEIVAPGAYELAGTLSISAGAMIDGDVNDPDHPVTQNDNPAQAQPIHSAASVAGFVAQRPTGHSGDAMAATADPWDYYRTFLLQDQAVTLEIAVHADGGVDLDLYLLDEAGALVAAAKGTGAIEQLQAPEEGTYLIAVQASQGASGYILALDAAPVQQSMHTLTSTSEFIPDEAIVAYAPEAESRGGAGPLSALYPDSPPQLLRLNGSAGGISTQSLAGDKLPHILTTARQNAKLRTLDAIKLLRRDPKVRAASPNFIRRPAALPNDPYYPAQWHYGLIDLPRAWELTGDSDAVVAVLDSGVFLAHPDLADHLTADGYDFISSPHMANDGDGIDPDPDDPGDLAHGSTSSWHGTHVAGTVAALSNNDLGVAGAARNTRVMPIRVLGVGGGTDYDIIQGLRYAAGLANDAGILPLRRADVINLSLGGGGYNPLAQEAIDQARAAGVIIVAAAGNHGNSTPSYPAAYNGVVSVGAVGADAARASYSNYGPSLDLMAPGGNLWQDLDGDGHGDGILSTSVREQSSGRTAGYAYQQGTSMAAPHVAGVAALMKTIYPELTPSQFSAAVGSGAITEDLGVSGRDDFTGHGLIDAGRAADYAADLLLQNAPADLVAEPRALNFGGTLDQLEIAIRRQGEGFLQVSSVSATDDWIRIAPLSVDSDGFGSYRVALERSALADGPHSSEVLVEADDGQVERVAVHLQVSTAGFASPAVIHFELRHAPSGSLVRRRQVAAEDGSFSFSFPRLAASDYSLAAGTDLDNDGILCEPGEVCRDYPADGLLSLDADATLAPFDRPLSIRCLPAGELTDSSSN